MPNKLKTLLLITTYILTTGMGDHPTTTNTATPTTAQPPQHNQNTNSNPNKPIHSPKPTPNRPNKILANRRPKKSNSQRNRPRQNPPLRQQLPNRLRTLQNPNHLDPSLHPQTKNLPTRQNKLQWPKRSMAKQQTSLPIHTRRLRRPCHSTSGLANRHGRRRESSHGQIQKRRPCLGTPDPQRNAIHTRSNQQKKNKKTKCLPSSQTSNKLPPPIHVQPPTLLAKHRQPLHHKLHKQQMAKTQHLHQNPHRSIKKNFPNRVARVKQSATRDPSMKHKTINTPKKKPTPPHNPHSSRTCQQQLQVSHPGAV